MGLPRKGSRAITVDGVDYRWRVRRNPTYSQGLTWSPMAVAVVLAREPGSRLVVSLDQPHPSNWVGEPAGPVLPSTVAAAIRAALKAG